MVFFLLVNILLGQFVQKWFLEKGTRGSYGRILVCDTDRDTQVELIFGYGENLQNRTEVYELYPDGIFHLEAIIDTMSNEAWEVGDFDNDGLFDLVLTGDFGLPVVGPQIYESPDSFSYPTQEVWRDTVGQAAVVPICVYDVDQDMLPEIFNNNGSGQPHWVWVYESTGNNQYDTVCTFNPMVDTFDYGINSTYAFGDFDGDSRVEFVAGDLGGHYWVFESPSNNTYEQVHQGQLPTRNIKDCFAVPDADGDGKMEFVVKGYWWGSQINAYIFEATGDNTYEIIKTFDFPCAPYSGGYSAAGDVDGDGIPEIVLESCQNVFIIKSAGNDSFYVWDTLPGNDGGSSIVMYDIDGNGLVEIVVSGNNQTRIYEYQVGIAEAGGSVVPQPRLEIFPNPFRHSATIRCSMSEATARIYDAAGRLVKSLCHGSGIVHHGSVILWDGDDDQGKLVAPGVYFVRLASARGRSITKIVKLR